MAPTENALAQGARRIVERLQGAGFEAFWVGGCVRDVLLGREPGDYDIATSALADEVERLFPETIPVGKKFGIVVVVEAGEQYQVATFRAESDYQDGRHPGQVSFGDPQADAQRRDFTINGLFFDPVKGTTRDWVGGERDLKAKLIRAIGDPTERFREDHLRLLRAVRFAAQLGFEIEKGTWAAICAQASNIRTISSERIRDELIKLFAPPHAAAGLRLLRESGLLREVLPEVEATSQCEQSPDFHPEGSVFNHLLVMLENMPNPAPPELPWAVLLHDIAKPQTATRDPVTGSIHFYGHEQLGATMASEILERLRFPRKEIEVVAHAVRCHMQFKDAPQMRQATLRRMLLRPTFSLELELHRLDCIGSHGRLDVYNFLKQSSADLDKKPEIHPPLLTGEMLKQLGMQPGPEMGRLLQEARDLQLEETLKSAEQAIIWAKQKLSQQ
jgi:poly(A) polymerase